MKERIDTLEANICSMLHASMGGELEHLFSECDLDHNGRISIDEFHVFLKEQGVVLTEEEEAYLFFKYDSNMDGSLNIDEFLHSANPEAAETKKLIADRVATLSQSNISAAMQTYRVKLEKSRKAGSQRDYEGVLSQEKRRTNQATVQVGRRGEEEEKKRRRAHPTFEMR